MTPNDWILSDDTGISSKTIWSVMMHAQVSRSDTPSAPSDFGRCYRLLQKFPEWRDRMDEVSNLYPEWGPMVDRWDEMTEIYEDEMPKLYKLMQELKEDCMVAGGWVRDGPYCWIREETAL